MYSHSSSTNGYGWMEASEQTNPLSLVIVWKYISKLIFPTENIVVLIWSGWNLSCAVDLCYMCLHGVYHSRAANTRTVVLWVGGGIFICTEWLAEALNGLHAGVLVISNMLLSFQLQRNGNQDNCMPWQDLSKDYCMPWQDLSNFFVKLWCA